MPTVTNLQEPTFRIPAGVGYKVYAYVLGGTTVPVSTYADRAGNTPNAWPVVLADDGAGNGVAQIYTAVDCTIVVKTAADVTVSGYPRDWLRPIILSELTAVDAKIAALVAGSTPLTGNLAIGGHKITGAADGSAATDYATVGQVPKIEKPLLSVYTNAEQSLSSTLNVDTYTKITGFTEVEKNYGTWWSTANNRFTPTIAGYYSFTAALRAYMYANGVDLTRLILNLYKNGSVVRRIDDIASIYNGYTTLLAGSGIVYLNGSTDYVELYVTTIAPTYVTIAKIGTPAGQNSGVHTYLQAFLIGA